MIIIWCYLIQSQMLDSHALSKLNQINQVICAFHMMLIWSQRIPLACSFKTNRINQVICAFYTMRYIFDSISVHLIWILFNLFSVWSQLFNVFGSHTLLYVIRSIVRIQFDCFGSISMIQCIQFPYSFKT